MGICWCKEKHDENDSYFTQSNNDNTDNAVQSVAPYTLSEYYLESAEKGCPDSVIVDKLIIETLGIIGTLVDKYGFNKFLCITFRI